MTDSVALTEFKQGVQLLRDEQPDEALEHFRNALELEKQNPYFISFVGVSLARAEKKWTPALKLCEMALSMKRNEAQLYINLVDVYMSAGRREEALMILDRAQASLGRHPRIQQERMKLGTRRPSPVSFLRRENVLNRYLGILRQRIFA